jgi:hypothetical protein
MISVSAPPSCTRTRKYARDDIPITVGTSEGKSTSSGGAVAILGVTVTNALERLFGDGTEAAHKSSGLARNREGASLLAEKRNFLRIFFLKNTIHATLFR